MSEAPSAIAIDTAPWIYWLEQDPRFLDEISEVLSGVLDGAVIAVTSVLTVLEVLTGTYARGDEALAQRYVDLFTGTRGVIVLDVDISIAREAARLRSRHHLRTPDSIHIATAIAASARTFVTTDRRLRKVTDIEVRVLRPGRGVR